MEVLDIDLIIGRFLVPIVVFHEPIRQIIRLTGKWSYLFCDNTNGSVTLNTRCSLLLHQNAIVIVLNLDELAIYVKVLPLPYHYAAISTRVDIGPVAGWILFKLPD
jgi:hypothetical protein